LVKSVGVLPLQDSAWSDLGVSNSDTKTRHPMITIYMIINIFTGIDNVGEALMLRQTEKLTYALLSKFL